MKDKVQKIKNWISKEQDGLMDANGNFEYPEHEGAYHILCNLDAYIDSLQEKPVSEDLGKVGSLKSFEYYPEKKTTNKTSKGVFDANMPRRKAYLRGFKDGAHAHKELIANKPVSEDLEEEIDNYVKRNGYDGLDSIEEVKYIAQYFTKWQKTKDDSCTSDLGDYINELSKQFPEVSFAKLSRIAVRVAKWQTLYDMGITERKAQNTVQDILKNGDELESFATEIAFKMFPANLQEPYHDMHRGRIVDAVMYGAEWQKENLWKPADGDDLPEIDREVIALTQSYPNDEHLRVVFAHRPNKYANVWNSDLGEEQVVEIERHDKGGWNIPDVKYWLDVDLPKLEED